MEEKKYLDLSAHTDVNITEMLEKILKPKKEEEEDKECKSQASSSASQQA